MIQRYKPGVIPEYNETGDPNEPCMHECEDGAYIIYWEYKDLEEKYKELEYKYKELCCKYVESKYDFLAQFKLVENKND